MNNMKKLYGSEVIKETEWQDIRNWARFKDAPLAQIKYQYTANGKKYETLRWQWTAESKVCTHTALARNRES